MSSHPRVVAIGEPVGVGHTVGHFIEALRRLGLRDEDTLASIEYGTSQMGHGRIVAEFNDDGHVEVREL
jgi:hypothetical protein